MTGSSIADLVDALHDGVERRIISYGTIRAIEVVVYGTRKTYDWIVEFVGKNASAGQRTVAADNDEGVNAMSTQDIVCQLTAFRCGELLAASCFENGSALLNDIGNILGVKLFYFIGYKPMVATIYTFDFKPIVYGRTSDGAYSGVHTGGIASGGQNSDAFDVVHSANEVFCCIVSMMSAII